MYLDSTISGIDCLMIMNILQCKGNLITGCNIFTLFTAINGYSSIGTSVSFSADNDCCCEYRSLSFKYDKYKKLMEI